MYQFSTAGVLACAGLYVVLYILLQITQDRKEPPPVATSIPFLDPLVGIFTEKVQYLIQLRDKYRLPITTIRLPFTRIYVVNQPALINTIQRQGNAFAFQPVALEFGFLFSGITKKSQAILRNAFSGMGNGFTAGVHKYLHTGSNLDMVSGAATDALSASVPGLAGQMNVGLLHTIQHDLALALTDAMYGPQNPFRDPEVEASWHDFVPGIKHLLYSPFPNITAYRSLQARLRVIAALQQYFRKGGHFQAFPMVREMFDGYMSHGLELEEAAKLDMATLLAMLSSGGIAAFWLMFRVLSNNVVLGNCRQEILANLASNDTLTPDGRRVTVIDLSQLKSKCPTLMAMLNETLRYHSTVISAKNIREDFLLDGQYLLKKDAMLMIPGPVVHYDAAIWGLDADLFNHRRFLFPASARKRLVNTSNFRPFGAGVTMCPGRHFSTNAMVSLAAMMLLQFDVKPKDGAWKIPSTNNADLWNAMPKPDWDVEVDILPRKDAEAVEWKFVWGAQNSMG
ncbi:cytochrome P450 [Massariosphaeria phaeospora]|uniref:Cytochrome P450 n=1 Tax=Massariosphaeria phaeospora TaxID=100035 RepID=A0A7C8I3N4_9PLEO|nr:cytochrome P450 [Massariosphaeria phaeospora]